MKLVAMMSLNGIVATICSPSFELLPLYTAGRRFEVSTCSILAEAFPSVTRSPSDRNKLASLLALP